MLRMGKSGWAWEWLRHSKAYQENKDIGAHVYRRVLRKNPRLTVIELKRLHSPKWGLCFAEDPRRPYQHAAVFWQPDIDSGVCPVSASPARARNDVGTIDILRLNVAGTVLVLPSGEEHLLLCDGVNS